MKKLFYYDLSRNKTYLLISFLCIIVSCIAPISCISVSVIEGSALFIISPIVMDMIIIASSYLIFHMMFMKRFTKDDILVLSSISRKEIAREPILFIIVYAFLSSYIVGMLTISGPYMIQHVCICFSGILIILSCVLSQWNAMNEHRGANNFIAVCSFIILLIYVVLYFIAPILSWSYEACAFLCGITVLLCFILNGSFYHRYHNVID